MTVGRKGWITLGALCLLTLGGGASKHGLEETWSSLDHRPQPMRKLIIVGISADREVRHRFEDLFVSHLRGRGYEAVTSYSMVPDLSEVKNRDLLIASILEQQIDGAISVRVARLAGKNDADWSFAWRKMLDDGTTLREMIDDALPQTGEKASRYGVEVAVWDTQDSNCVWGGRTNTYSRKALKKGAADLTQFVMARLRFDEIL